MIKLVSDAMEMSARKRKLHVVHGFLEYILIVTISMIAIVTCIALLFDQFQDLANKNGGTATSISTLLQ